MSFAVGARVADTDRLLQKLISSFEYNSQQFVPKNYEKTSAPLEFL